MRPYTMVIPFLFIFAIAIFLWLSGTGEYQSSKENEERVRVRKEELARANPDLLAQLEKSRETLEQKVKESPDDSTLWFELGTHKYQLGDYAGAKKALKKAAQLNTVSINALINLGVLYQDLAEYENAENSFQEVIGRHPNLPDGYIRLAELYRPGIYKDTKEEEKILLEGLAIMPNDKVLLLTLAEYYERAKLYNQAVIAYRKLLALNPPDRSVIEEEIARLERQASSS